MVVVYPQRYRSISVCLNSAVAKFSDAFTFFTFGYVAAPAMFFAKYSKIIQQLFNSQYAVKIGNLNLPLAGGFYSWFHCWLTVIPLLFSGFFRDWRGSWLFVRSTLKQIPPSVWSTMLFKSFERGTETSAGANLSWREAAGVSSEYVCLGIHPEDKGQWIHQGIHARFRCARAACIYSPNCNSHPSSSCVLTLTSPLTGVSNLTLG